MSRKPALTDRVLRGLIAATSFILAGDPDLPTSEEREIVDADRWARLMREWKKQKRSEEQS